MKTFVSWLMALMVLCLGLAVPSAAEIVGKITQVEGRVDFLKGGNLPATAAKLEDGVEVGDVLRTKSLSKAQITFMDNTVITISPEARIAIEEYMFNPGQGKRSAVLQVFQGLAHVVVSKLFKVAEPDFVVKTNTAVMGVRGTDIGLRIHPNSSTILNFEGKVEVGNIFPEVGDLLFKKAYKIAFSWGGATTVLLGNMQGTTVFRGLPPTIPFGLTAQDQQQFLNQTTTGLGSGRGSGGPSGPTYTYTTPTAVAQDSSQVTSSSGGGGTGTAGGTALTFTPSPTGGSQVITPVTPPPPSPTYNNPTSGSNAGPYTITLTSNSQFTSTDPESSSSSYTTTATGWAQATAGWSSNTLYYTSSGIHDRTVLQGPMFTGTVSGNATGSLSGTVTGTPGQTLTGTGTYSGTDSYGDTIKYTGTITVDPSGKLTFTYTNGTVSGTSRLASSTGTITYTPGTFITQITDGAVLRTSANPYNTAYMGTPTTITTGSGQTTISSVLGTNLWAGGSRTGVLPGNFDFSLSGTETSPWKYWFTNNSNGMELGDVTTTMEGVVSPASGGGYQGAVTIIPSHQKTPFVSSLLPQFQPSIYQFLAGSGSDNFPMVSPITINSDGSASGTIYQTQFQDGKFTSSVYNFTQTVPQTSASTPVAATYNFTESYNGALMLNSFPMASVNGFGWGQRSFNGTGSTPGTSIYNSYFTSYDSGVWTATSGTLPSYYGSSLAAAQITGSVSGTLGKTLSGSMTFIGSLLNGASFHYQGPATLDSSGDLTFNYGGSSSTWTFPGGVSGTATGTMNQNPGYHFTQTMTGDNYQITTGDSSSATLNVASSSSNSGSRSGVYGGTTGPFSGTFSLNYQTGGVMPASGTGASLTLEGVVSPSALGATAGIATLQFDTTDVPVLSLYNIPGMVSLTAGGSGLAGGTFFSPWGGIFVQSNSPYPVQVSGSLSQTPTWSFTESYQGFRIASLSTSPYLANIEGYGWTKFTSSSLPSSSYLGTGYGLIQDLGTRASASPLTSNILGVTGTLSGYLSGVAGQTLSGGATFTGTTSSGTSFNYQGQVLLSSSGQLYFSYGGMWTAASGKTGTGSGMIQQVPGTYFTETLTGQYGQAITSNGYNLFTTGQQNMTGTRTMYSSGDPTNTSTVGSFATLRSSTVTNSFTPSGGSASVSLQGVVAGPSWQTQWGVASLTPTYTPSGGTASTTGATTTGPVTIDPTGTLTHQSVGTIPNGNSGPPHYTALPADTISGNLISVPASSGQVVYGYAQSASGPFSQTASSDGSSKIVTASLTGKSGSVNTNVSLSITSTALNPNSYVANSGTMIVNSVGVLAGPAGGVQTGVSTHHAVRTLNGDSTIRTPVYLGSTTFNPTSAAMTTALYGVNRTGTGGASQTGTMVVTPK